MRNESKTKYKNIANNNERLVIKVIPTTSIHSTRYTVKYLNRGTFTCNRVYDDEWVENREQVCRSSILMMLIRLRDMELSIHNLHGETDHLVFLSFFFFIFYFS